MSPTGHKPARQPRNVLSAMEKSNSCFSTSFHILSHHWLHLESDLGPPMQHQCRHTGQSTGLGLAFVVAWKLPAPAKHHCAPEVKQQKTHSSLCPSLLCCVHRRSPNPKLLWVVRWIWEGWRYQALPGFPSDFVCECTELWRSHSCHSLSPK